MHITKNRYCSRDNFRLSNFQSIRYYTKYHLSNKMRFVMFFAVYTTNSFKKGAGHEMCSAPVLICWKIRQLVLILHYMNASRPARKAARFSSRNLGGTLSRTISSQSISSSSSATVIAPKSTTFMHFGLPSSRAIFAASSV